MSALRVGVWGVFGHGNFGNEATLAAFLQQLDAARYAPVILTEDPEPAAAAHGVPARVVGAPFSERGGGRLTRALGALLNRIRYLGSAVRLAGDLDAVVLAGTGGLERAGAFGTPFEMWGLAVAARVRRRPVILLDVGVERLDDPVARFFARGVARAARYRSYRDLWSRDNMVANGFRDAAGDPVVTDMAFALEPKAATSRDDTRVVVGVIEIGGRGGDQTSARGRYIAAMAQLIVDLRSAGRSVVLVAGDDADLDTASEVADRVGRDVVSVDPASTPDELTLLMSGAGAVVASRYHTLIMSLIAQTPVVSIGYSRKHLEMLRQFGLPEVHQDIDEFESGEVAAQVQAVITDRPAIQERIVTGLRTARARLDAHWPEVHGAICGRSRARR